MKDLEFVFITICVGYFGWQKPYVTTPGPSTISIAKEYHSIDLAMLLFQVIPHGATFLSDLLLPSFPT